ncbi:glycosyltransferase family 2 protein [Paracoccus sp. 1_MG-2023]|uniref:glycosyltransferase family 2 protein n=1 Tax=unclassified Paracoccus (in: a-proteobacteria) TaxID=2688777 RepID=UPI001C0A56FC|nr:MULTISPECIES: glycosyltransferase family 2 protein [unclassified Paracoccus (in: a-proteobacteria)]MBU2958194.1 glycosyltransferase family 2 protein [Paracoccus sp. C2R09]MDO6668321.1 glycosyltransferase family 2 protein [Paracoccus sp. 1_MG-2023]
MPVLPVTDRQDFLSRPRPQLARGPIAIIFVEDHIAVSETVAHHMARGFRHILLMSELTIDLPEELAARVTQLRHDSRRPDAHVGGVNAVIAAVPAGTWLYYCFNAEFLFHPFGESRSVGEMLTFHTEERRDAMLTYVVDLYAGDLGRFPDAVDLEQPMFDRTGYYALGRKGADGRPCDRQLDFHGGLRWRYEELLPPDRRRIDRIALFRAAPGLRVTADHRFNIEEYNTYSCPWHHNLTASIASFRVAKALARNPGSRDRLGRMTWRNSQPFRWSSQQLMDLGLMEPGQWF